MMTSKEIRKAYLDFFKAKSHEIVASAPIVVKDDPTLMFTNAGMNQFKDIFLGNKGAKSSRVADTQKCLRVSGKHNDLEEVGVDTYHHTMFEMLGNWSFGDYFKKEAIDWAWEFLTEVIKLDKDRLYASVFMGDEEDGLPLDQEAIEFWKAYLPEDRILHFDKSDNFWEMGDTGPCGPCSEIHVDLRSDEERAKVPGVELVNADHPLVVEIWNLVFIQFNRKSDRSLESLPAKHVDTGMGFERLCMAIQNKKSNYDTDVFTPIIAAIEGITGKKYEAGDDKRSVAFRVIADHARAIMFTISDGQLPSNTGAGYVIRRILRRAVRYAYSYLDYQQPILFQLLPTLFDQFGEVFPDLLDNKTLLENVIKEEENAFLRTLELGLKRFAQIEQNTRKENKTVIDGEVAFELFDTYGFPIDLTELMASEIGMSVDKPAFDAALTKQKERSRQATNLEYDDWVVMKDDNEVEFVGYDVLSAHSEVLKYRKVKEKKKELYQFVLNVTPFYAESGGQVGDTGYLEFGEEKITVIDTKKENDLIIHYTAKLPSTVTPQVNAVVNTGRRDLTAKNHTATHLLHAALRDTLGEHVHQKGSLVHPDYLRFDFSHFSKIEAEDLAKIEQIVNEKVRENIPLEEDRYKDYDEAIASGAMALFGEKYGDKVRMITFDKNFSVELCGGTHVNATGEIGLCKITTETSVAAGVRRIVALTGPKAYEHINEELGELNEIRGLFKNPKGIVKTVETAIVENTQLKKELEQLHMQKAGQIKNDLKAMAENVNGVQFIAQKIEVGNADMVKKIAFDLKNEVPNLFLALGANISGKAHLTLMIDEELSKAKDLNASKLIRDLAKHIQGGGGGQAYYASAGGKNPEGIDQALSSARELVG